MEKWQYLLCVVNEDPSKNVQVVDKNCEAKRVVYRNFMRLDEILAENSGFLISGELRVRVEIRVLSFIDVFSGLSTFNFYDPFENCVTVFTHDQLFYVNKQVMMNHCERLRDRILDGETQFSVLIPDFEWQALHDTLQCIHGYLGFRNCGPYYEDAIFRLSGHWGIPIHQWYLERMYNIYLIWAVEDIYADRYMKNELKSVTSQKELKKRVLNWKLKKLSEEMMKAIAQKFFFFAIDSEIVRLKRVKNLQELRIIVEKWDLEDLELRLMVEAIHAFFSSAVPPKECSEDVKRTKSLDELQKQT